MKLSTHTNTTATYLTLIIALGLVCLGLHMLSLPAITLFRVWPYYLLPAAEVVLAMGLLLVLFRRQGAHCLTWIGTKLHRWLTAVLLLCAISADGLLHVFSIPHVEGWWVTLIGSSALLSATHAWLHKFKRTHSCSAPSSSMVVDTSAHSV